MKPRLTLSATQLVPLSLAVLLALPGCSTTIFDNKIDYKSARQIQPLEIPPDLTAPSRDERYSVPDITPSNGQATYSAYSADRTPQSAAARTVAEDTSAQNGMHIERAGEERWLVVPGQTDKVWPLIKDFWLEMGFVLDYERPELGTMETDWAENRAKIPQDFIRDTLGKVVDGLFSTPERDKFRTRIEKGAAPNSVEIYVSHRGMQEIYPNEAKDSTIWQPAPPNRALEAEMLRRIMVKLGATEQRAKETLAAQSTPGARTVLSQEGGRTALTVKEPFDRAWRRVGLALDRSGFAVEDRDRNQGIYYVRYVDPDRDWRKNKDNSFISKLAFWRSDDQAKLANTEFRLKVESQGDNAVLKVLSKEGGEDQSETAKRILTILNDQLK